MPNMYETECKVRDYFNKVAVERLQACLVGFDGDAGEHRTQAHILADCANVLRAHEAAQRAVSRLLVTGPILR